MRADERTSLLSSDADEGRRCAGGDAKRTSALTWTLRGLATVAIVGCVAVVASSGLNEPALDRAHGSDANLGTAARGVVKNARSARISTGDARAWTVDATEARGTGRYERTAAAKRAPGAPATPLDARARRAQSRAPWINLRRHHQ